MENLKEQEWYLGSLWPGLERMVERRDGRVGAVAQCAWIVWVRRERRMSLRAESSQGRVTMQKGDWIMLAGGELVVYQGIWKWTGRHLS
jgi:hypothetical protein